jgi:hypothetical protein
MQFQSTTRRVGALIMLVSVALAAACSNASATDPTQTLKAGSHRASMDDDPSQCRSGWTEMDGHIYCNP